MQNLKEFKSPLRFILTDIDDTMTTDGQLSPQAYSALSSCLANNIAVIPVTGRPAGWCDMIARFWPVAGVIGENGALYYRYKNKKMHRWYSQDNNVRLQNAEKLKLIEQQILNAIPECAISADQFCRLFDLAVDFCEDIPRLSDEKIQHIASIFHQHGATAKISSIHVNGWFGTFNKVTTAKIFLQTEFKLTDEQILNDCAYIGDSPNDEPLFEKFKHTFGVANVKNFSNQMTYLPRYVSEKNSGDGFVEIIKHIIEQL